MRVCLYICVLVCAGAIFALGCEGGLQGSSADTFAVTLEDDQGMVLTTGASVGFGRSFVVSSDALLDPTSATMECCYLDGTNCQDLTIDVTGGGTSLSVVPTWLTNMQKNECTLSVGRLGGGAETWELLAGCALEDDFVNSDTFDVAASGYGDGCWFNNFENLPTDSVAMANGTFVVDYLMVGNYGMFKRLNGEDYMATFVLDDWKVTYSCDPGDGGTGSAVILLLTDVVSNVRVTNWSWVSMLYGRGCNDITDLPADAVEISVQAGTGAPVLRLQSELPATTGEMDFGLIRDDSKVVPYYSYDGGVTKRCLDVNTATAIVYDGPGSICEIDMALYFDAAFYSGDMDYGITFASRGDANVTEQEAVLNGITVTGDAELVE